MPSCVLSQLRKFCSAMAICRLKSVDSAPVSNACSSDLFWNQRIHSALPTAGTPGGVGLNSGDIWLSCGLSAVMWQLMHELRGLSTGPLSRPFHPRCVEGRSEVALMIDSLMSGLILVTFGVGLVYVSALFSGSFPNMRPTGVRLSHGFLLLSAPLYWNVPKIQPSGARWSRTAMSI